MVLRAYGATRLWVYGAMGLWGYGAIGLSGFGVLEYGLWGYGDMGLWGYGVTGLWGYWAMGLWGFGAMGYGAMEIWDYGAMEIWAYGAMGIWVYGAMRLWGYGAMEIWGYGALLPLIVVQDGEMSGLQICLVPHNALLASFVNTPGIMRHFVMRSCSDKPIVNCTREQMFGDMYTVCHYHCSDDGCNSGSSLRLTRARSSSFAWVVQAIVLSLWSFAASRFTSVFLTHGRLEYSLIYIKSVPKYGISGSGQDYLGFKEMWKLQEL
ncbi:hypothetical protein EGW08_003017 [Elysia chlorotica]|uniref:Uncharacterized protein n=1 Tax=Elysia chlorotica TaxID=188477 RepID=A0A3S1ADK0_ELYCH|nr:hypothetical protein EGW08_003017 [Elysia chlorotica]